VAKRTRKKPDPAAQVYSALRLAQYRTRWGEPVSTKSFEVAGSEIHIHAFKTADPSGKPFHVLLTDGLSNEEIVPDAPRNEFVWYVKKPEEIHYDWLTFVATVFLIDAVHLEMRMLPIASPPSNQAPLAKKSVLSSAVFIESILTRDREPLLVAGGKAQVLWLIPISEAERAYLREAEHMGEALGTMLEENEHPFVLDPLRKSYR
jgi:hypothetical protein